MNSAEKVLSRSCIFCPEKKKRKRREETGRPLSLFVSLLSCLFLSSCCFTISFSRSSLPPSILSCVLLLSCPTALLFTHEDDSFFWVRDWGCLFVSLSLFLSSCLVLFIDAFDSFPPVTLDLAFHTSILSLSLQKNRKEGMIELQLPQATVILDDSRSVWKRETWV